MGQSMRERERKEDPLVYTAVRAEGISLLSLRNATGGAVLLASCPALDEITKRDQQEQY